MIVQPENASKFARLLREYKPEIKFVLIFSVGLIAAFLVINSAFATKYLIRWITEAETFVAAKVLSVIGFPNTVESVHLAGAQGNVFRMKVENNCNGVYESVVFLMAFIAIQIPWRRKFGWMAFGFCLFHVINEMRLISLFIIGSKYSEETFRFFHETFWNYVLVFFTLAIFIFCAHRVSKSTPKMMSATKGD